MPTALRHITAGYNIVLWYVGNFVAKDKNYVTTETVAISIFLLLFCWNYLLFQLTSAKHKVGEYSIILHKNRFETVKNMSEKWIKNR